MVVVVRLSSPWLPQLLPFRPGLLLRLISPSVPGHLSWLPDGRRYKKSLAVHSQTKLNAVARQLNERPRKTLKYETPADRFKACVASIR